MQKNYYRPLVDFNLISRHSKYDPRVEETLHGENPAEISSVSTVASRTAHNWQRQVLNSYQRSRAFARLKISQYGILYGRIEPEHYVEDMVARWFSSRFPMFAIIIESKRGTFAINRDKNLEILQEPLYQVLSRYEKMLPKSDMLSDLVDFNSDEFWNSYYKSQHIKQRKNRRYFLKNMPKKCHLLQSLECERDSFLQNKKLSDY
jgi:probable DNA metabolism protein